MGSELGKLLWWLVGFPIVIFTIIGIIYAVYKRRKRIERETITEGSEHFDPEIYNISTWYELYEEKYGDFENNRDIKYLKKNLSQIISILDGKFKHKLRYIWMQKTGEDLYRGALKSHNVDLITQALVWRDRLLKYLDKNYHLLVKFKELYLFEELKNSDILDELIKFYNQYADDYNKLLKIRKRFLTNINENVQSNELIKAYRTLGLSPNATIEQVKAARLKLMMKYHPDHNSSPDAAKKFIAIQNAFELITKNK